MAGSSKKKAKDGRTSPTKEAAKARTSPEKDAGKGHTSSAKKTTKANDEERPPRNFEEYCVKDGEAVLTLEEIHPTALCLLQMREKDIIFGAIMGNVSMMKPENAAEILDGLLGGHLDLKPNIQTGQRLDANKMQLNTTYARVSKYL
jgi:hypothetical protein